MDLQPYKKALTLYSHLVLVVPVKTVQLRSLSSWA
jgi:hypothetical protein